MGHTGSLYGPAYSLVDIGVGAEQPESNFCIVALCDQNDDAVFYKGRSAQIYMIISVAKVPKGRYSPLKIVVYHPESFEQIHEFEVATGMNTAGYNEYDAWLELHHITHKASMKNAQKTIREMHINTFQILPTSVTLTSDAIKEKSKTLLRHMATTFTSLKQLNLKRDGDCVTTAV